MLPKEILKKVKLLEISTRKMVDNLFAGEYHTVFKGQGLTFADFREYVPGDEIRSISWNLTAKTGKPFVKRYDEERELTMMLVVDISGSGDFGSGEYLKGEVLVQIAAVLAFTAAKNNDRVGLLLFSDHVEHFVPPKKGRGHVHRILRDLLYFKPTGKKTDLKLALDSLSGVLKKKATVFILSDFLGEGFDRALKLVGRRHDVVAIIVEDQAESKMPTIGLVEMQDAETGEVVMVDTSSSWFKKEYGAAFQKARENRDKQLRQAQVDQIRVNTTHSFFDPLVKFFASRHSRW
jgi:uncharacterized protein (DUF58 family)